MISPYRGLPVKPRSVIWDQQITNTGLARIMEESAQCGKQVTDIFVTVMFHLDALYSLVQCVQMSKLPERPFSPGWWIVGLQRTSLFLIVW